LRREFLYPLILFICSGLVYINTLSNPFVFDDQHAIERNLDIRQLWPPNWAFPSSELHSAINSRPLTSFSFALNYALGQERVEGYRLVNIALHILCGLCMYGVVWRLLAHIKYLVLRARELAFISALLWALHPLNSQVVNYITQRGESLMALCYLGMIYCFLRGINEDRSIWQLGAVLCCAVGMAAKEVMVSAPLVLWCCDGLFLCQSYRLALVKRWKLYAGLACSWLVLLWGLWTLPHGDTIGFDLGVDSWTYLLNQSHMLTTYIKLVLWPYPLVLDYGLPRDLDLVDVWWQAGSVLAAVILSGVGVYRRWRWAFVGVFALLVLAPTSSFVPLVNEVGAERRMYLPLAALSTGMVVLIAELGRNLGHRNWLSWPLVMVVAMLLGWSTVKRNEDYASGISIWRSSLSVVEKNSRGHYNLAYYLAAAGETEEALFHYRRALELQPGFKNAHIKLGLLLVTIGDISLAVDHYRRALLVDPDFVDAHINLGMALAVLELDKEALAHYHRALALDENLALVHYNIGAVLEKSGSLSEAISHYQQALSLDPELETAHYRLGLLYARSGDLSCAVSHLRAVVALNAENGEAHFHIGRVLIRLGSVVEGMEYYQLALEIAPDRVEAHFNLGTELMKRGDDKKALTHFEQAVVLAPNMAELRNNLGIVLQRLGKRNQALIQFHKALELRPDYAEARQNLAVLTEQ
jgi:protein O-mannosyl-transferase